MVVTPGENVGATLVVARASHPATVCNTNTGDHKGRPYDDSGNSDLRRGSLEIPLIAPLLG